MSAPITSNVIALPPAIKVEFGVIHASLRLHATPYGRPNAMLEKRNDLTASPDAEQRMADLLAPVLNMGLVEIQKQAKAG